MALTTAGVAACGKCRYFDQASTESHGASLGLCRYNPPISQPTQDSHGVWPKVEASDWCGHYERAEA
ncbi:hypothetical protein [Sphingomonas lenta]|uniref:High-potential iron-sulfur protein n=1 Tax=Sphingomonas lenta TaxID=1141887 RepID=A0A2A2SJP7_9SPHN|nr:hypothetical protein [Sphingomonas lenta]PAX09453.1 hypothetical protein CKY28_01480 [Sphingomonas lenta]